MDISAKVKKVEKGGRPGYYQSLKIIENLTKFEPLYWSILEEWVNTGGLDEAEKTDLRVEAMKLLNKHYVRAQPEEIHGTGDPLYSINIIRHTTDGDKDDNPPQTPG